VTTTTASARDASFHSVQRRLAALLPDATPLSGGATLELASQFPQDKPRLDPPELIEGRTLRAHVVQGGPLVRFAAFVDGTQTSRVVQYVSGIPIVHGSVAAVVRVRQDRRMRTWRQPLVSRGLYAPLGLLPDRARFALLESGAEVFDTGANRDIESMHPFALQEAALTAVQRHRSALERELAEQWVRAGDGALFVDGGISESDEVARSSLVVGVVKTHQQLYVHGDDLPTLLSLRAGERSSVTLVSPRSRTPVMSWYLRLRESAGRDPLWGLVRVECADIGHGMRTVAARANEVSRWVLAEALPLALPDGRWDKMVYGIRDCEEFLRAIQ
jgi:hypothetical protein